jgi:hypothetical protein
MNSKPKALPPPDKNARGWQCLNLIFAASALRADFEPQARCYTQSAFLRPK